MPALNPFGLRYLADRSIPSLFLHPLPTDALPGHCPIVPDDALLSTRGRICVGAEATDVNPTLRVIVENSKNFQKISNISIFYWIFQCFCCFLGIKYHISSTESDPASGIAEA